MQRVPPTVSPGWSIPRGVTPVGRPPRNSISWAISSPTYGPAGLPLTTSVLSTVIDPNSLWRCKLTCTYIQHVHDNSTHKKHTYGMYAGTI